MFEFINYIKSLARQTIAANSSSSVFIPLTNPRSLAHARTPSVIPCRRERTLSAIAPLASPDHLVHAEALPRIALTRLDPRLDTPSATVVERTGAIAKF